jgi:uncharacterized protein YjbJ (UPF0337 family)
LIGEEAPAANTPIKSPLQFLSFPLDSKNAELIDTTAIDRAFYHRVRIETRVAYKEPRAQRTIGGSASKVLGNGKRRTQMKDSTKNQVQGRVNEVKGKIKEKVGQVTNDPNLQAEGQEEKLGGKIQKKVGQVEKVFEK